MITLHLDLIVHPYLKNNYQSKGIQLKAHMPHTVQHNHSTARNCAVE